VCAEDAALVCSGGIQLLFRRWLEAVVEGVAVGEGEQREKGNARERWNAIKVN